MIGTEGIFLGNAMLRRLFLLTALTATLAGAATLPYDESADAKAAVQQALSVARTDKVPVLVIFGANWCEDCRALDLALKSGPNAELMAKEFKVVKVDVGNFNRNLDVDRAYGDPIRKGIPAAVVLSPDAQVLYATRAGELANARRMSESGVHDFFKAVVQAAAGK
jgi:protein disulfide-isomerase